MDSPWQGVVRGQESPAPGARLPSSGEIQVVLLSEVQSVHAQPQVSGLVFNTGLGLVPSLHGK